jgi:pimeloyl-ACP methyl ester carboxylesterase
VAKIKAPYIEEYGQGTPLVFFHGFPGSHIQGTIFQACAEKFAIKILAVDRPGYANSDPNPRTSLKDFMPGLELALKERNVDRFYVVGLSGGNPAALSTAAYFKDRVIALGSICGLAPFANAPETYPHEFRKGLNIIRRMPEFILKPIVEKMVSSFDPKTKMAGLIARLSESDQMCLQDQTVRMALLESMLLARRHGSAGILFDLRSYTSPWPVNFAEIKCPYFLWHGEKDKILPSEMSHYMHSQVPHSKLTLLPEEGHYSLPIKKTELILSDLTSASAL